MEGRVNNSMNVRVNRHGSVSVNEQQRARPSAPKPKPLAPQRPIVTAAAPPAASPSPNLNAAAFAELRTLRTQLLQQQREHEAQWRRVQQQLQIDAKYSEDQVRDLVHELANRAENRNLAITKLQGLLDDKAHAVDELTALLHEKIDALAEAQRERDEMRSENVRLTTRLVAAESTYTAAYDAQMEAQRHTATLLDAEYLHAKNETMLRAKNETALTWRKRRQNDSLAAAAATRPIPSLMSRATARASPTPLFGQFPRTAGTLAAGQTLGTTTVVRSFDGPPAFVGGAAHGALAPHRARGGVGALASIVQSGYPLAPPATAALALPPPPPSYSVPPGLRSSSSQQYATTTRSAKLPAWEFDVAAEPTLEAVGLPTYDARRAEALGVHSDRLSAARAARLGGVRGGAVQAPRQQWAQPQPLAPQPSVYVNRHGSIDIAAAGGTGGRPAGMPWSSARSQLMEGLDLEPAETYSIYT